MEQAIDEDGEGDEEKANGLMAAEEAALLVAAGGAMLLDVQTLQSMVHTLRSSWMSSTGSIAEGQRLRVYRQRPGPEGQRQRLVFRGLKAPAPSVIRWAVRLIHAGETALELCSRSWLADSATLLVWRHVRVSLRGVG